MSRILHVLHAYPGIYGVQTITNRKTEEEKKKEKPETTGETNNHSTLN